MSTTSLGISFVFDNNLTTLSVIPTATKTQEIAMVTVVSMFTKFLVYLGYIAEAFKIAVSVFSHFQTSPIDKTLQHDLSSHKSSLKVEMIGIVCSSF